MFQSLFYFGSLFTIYVNSQIIPGSQVDVSGHNCVIDGGYQWCEELSSCVRSWETSCPSLNDIDECSEPCPPPAPCPIPEMSDININDCIVNNHLDNCGCQLRCPTYNCMSTKHCQFSTDCPDNQVCIRDSENLIYKCVEPVNLIPDNCLTWHDGCNTCQVRDGRAEICTLMYCFQRTTPHCLSYSIQSDSLEIGDVCYRFCEDNSQETINRINDCPRGTICKSVFSEHSVSMISYDSCDDRASTCLLIGH